ncbi:hypothetical protein SAMN04487934_10381 [Eubacterium ruminantium]|nr:hypothetical protein SAMN04487934_10381 [Eubacterium ruminantium]
MNGNEYMYFDEIIRGTDAYVGANMRAANDHVGIKSNAANISTGRSRNQCK